MSVASEDRVSAARAVGSPFSERGAESQPVDPADMSLRRAVLARLIADPLVCTGHIAVAASAGRVTLSGYVTSNAQKDAASAATRRVKGVEQVADEVSVAIPCPAAADPPSERPPARPTLVAAPSFRAFAPAHATRVVRAELRS